MIRESGLLFVPKKTICFQLLRMWKRLRTASDSITSCCCGRLSTLARSRAHLEASLQEVRKRRV